MAKYPTEPLDKTEHRSHYRWLAVVLLAVTVIGVVVLFAHNWLSERSVTNFDECREAGGSILESYPEQCLIGGLTYVNESQADNSGDYIGMTEEQALAKAESEQKIARVVSREGVSIPVTMDYVEGRLNLTIKNGAVHRIDVESSR